MANVLLPQLLVLKSMDGGRKGHDAGKVSHSSECLAIKFCVVHETVSGGSLGHAACKISLYSESSLAAI